MVLIDKAKLFLPGKPYNTKKHVFWVSKLS
jgi:hypothetical protein